MQIEREKGTSEGTEGIGMNEKEQAIYEAWVNPGIAPSVHYAEIRSLKKRWPTLHNAIEEWIEDIDPECEHRFNSDVGFVSCELERGHIGYHYVKVEFDLWCKPGSNHDSMPPKVQVGELVAEE